MNHYRAAGVDIDAGNRAVALMQDAVRSTFTPAVLADVGSFGGLFALQNLPAQPVLVASTDGVGTKVMLAAEYNGWHGIGHDIVNHCINDILVQNARPLFFLDYIASSKLHPERVAEVVTGMAEACRAANCALIGGETAEMPGVYVEGAFDLAGTVIGMVDRAALLPDRDAMGTDSVLIGLPSSGPHTNGYSLIRKAIAGQDLQQKLESGATLLEALLAPHRSYLPEVEAVQKAGIAIQGMAHLTGGSFVENLPRVLPLRLAARVNVAAWQTPQLFRLLTKWSGMEASDEAYRVFNMGIGMVLIVARKDARKVLQMLEGSVHIGELIPRGIESIMLYRERP